MADKNATKNRKIPWNSLLSLFAVLVSLFAVFFTVWSDDKTRECEFRYVTYDRLVQLARYIDEEILRHGQFDPDMSKILKQHESGSDIDAENANKLFDTFSRHSVDAVIKSKRELMLQMVNFDDKDLSPVLDHADQARKQFNTWVEERNAGSDSDESYSAFFYTAKSFWPKVYALVDSGIESTAKRIHEICR